MIKIKKSKLIPLIVIFVGLVILQTYITYCILIATFSYTWNRAKIIKCDFWTEKVNASGTDHKYAIRVKYEFLANGKLWKGDNLCFFPYSISYAEKKNSVSYIEKNLKNLQYVYYYKNLPSLNVLMNGFVKKGLILVTSLYIMAMIIVIYLAVNLLHIFGVIKLNSKWLVK